MDRIISCGVIILNERQEVFVCHATGTGRWDLPKGLAEHGERARDTAVRETWEETSLSAELRQLPEVPIVAVKTDALSAGQMTR